MKKQNLNMLEGPLFSNIVSYTIPIILTSLLQLLFNAADMIVVGRFCGSVSVAAVGSTGSITNLIINLFVGLSVGAGVTVAHALGSRQNEAVHRTIHTALPTALVCGGILTVVGICFADNFLQLMDTPASVLPLSTVYMRIYFGGIIFTMVYNFCASILRAAGDTKNPLIFLSIAGIVNVLLNFFFVCVLHMNVAGVALATIISQGISAVSMVVILMRRTDACRLELSKLRFYKAQLVKMIQIGLPAGIQGSLFSISNVLIQSSVNSFGDVFMSGNASAANIEGFVYVCINSFSQTAVNFVGQNHGAHQYKRINKIIWLCLGCAAVVGISLGSITYTLAPKLLSIYITDSPEAISYGIIRMSFVCLCYFLCGLMDVTTGALRGMGASVVTMIISILCICGTRILWVTTVFQIPRFHTPQMLFVSYPISWTATFLIQLGVFYLVYNRHRRAAHRMSA